jgi:hypothetical protein
MITAKQQRQGRTKKEDRGVLFLSFHLFVHHSAKFSLTTTNFFPSYHSAFPSFCQILPDAFTETVQSVATRTFCYEANGQTFPSN